MLKATSAAGFVILHPLNEPSTSIRHAALTVPACFLASAGNAGICAPPMVCGASNRGVDFLGSPESMKSAFVVSGSYKWRLAR